MTTIEWEKMMRTWKAMSVRLGMLAVLLGLPLSLPAQQLWEMRYNGPGSGDDGPHAIAADSRGNVLVAGYSTGTTSGWDATLIKYDTTGKQLWVRRHNG